MIIKLMSATNFLTLKNFLMLNDGVKEVGLIVASDELELNNFTQELIDEGLKESRDVKDLVSNKRTYFHLKSTTSDTSLKYIKEYGTGSVGFRSRQSDKFQWHYPDYKNSLFIVICTEKDLDEFHDRHPNTNIYNYTTNVYRTIGVKIK